MVQHPSWFSMCCSLDVAVGVFVIVVVTYIVLRVPFIVSILDIYLVIVLLGDPVCVLVFFSCSQ